MAKHYLILSSQVTSAMRSLSEHEETVTYLQVSDANAAAMDTILGGVDDENWVKSSTLVLEQGSVNGILLPKSAGK